MARQPKPKDLAPEPIADGDVQTLIAEAQQSAEEEIAALRRQRAEVLKQVARDPRGASSKVRELDQRIADATAHLQTLADALAQEQVEAIEATKRARAAASATDRAAVVRLAGQRATELAPTIDQAFDAVLEAVVRYRDSGNACAAFAQRAIVNLYEGDTYRMHDALSLTLHRSTGNGPDVAVALAAQFQRITKALGAPAMDGLVSFNAFASRHPATFAQAARMDADALTERFTDHPAAEPQPAEATA